MFVTPNEEPGANRLSERQEPGGAAGVAPPETEEVGTAQRATAETQLSSDSGSGDSATQTDAANAALANEMATLLREREEAVRRAEECWDRYLRAEAEIENTRKRALRQREEALASLRRDILSRMLTVADNLERALAHAGDDSGPLRAGVEATYRELTRILATEGVQRIEALDAPFDPALHEATAVVLRPDLQEERVIAVDLPGYTLDGALLRPARVVVGKPASSEEPS